MVFKKIKRYWERRKSSILATITALSVAISVHSVHLVHVNNQIVDGYKNQSDVRAAQSLRKQFEYEQAIIEQGWYHSDLAKEAYLNKRDFKIALVEYKIAVELYRAALEHGDFPNMPEQVFLVDGKEFTFSEYKEELKSEVEFIEEVIIHLNLLIGNPERYDCAPIKE